MTAYDVGDFAILTLAVPEGTAGTTAAVTSWTRPDGTAGALPTAGPLDTDHKSWEAVSAALDTAGDWTAVWTVTGPGAAVETHHVQVAPLPPVAARSYATTADLAGWLQAAPPAGSARLLARATEVVDAATVTALYEVTGTDELPSDTAVAAAFRDAVCAQVEAWQANGSSTAGPGAAQWQTMTAGRISLGRAGGSTAVAPHGDQLADHAASILRRAGLLGRPLMAF